jgi:ParB family transcriptional regulator, chromosome partitioning protein
MTSHVHISRLREHPANIREDLGDLTELAASITAQGILQPLVVQPVADEPGAYEVIAGHRRLAAARLTRLQQIPITVRQPRPGGSPPAAAAVEMMLVENCMRRDLNAVEKAEAMGALRNHGLTATQIARRTGLSDATVGYYLSLLDLDDEARNQVRDGRIPVGQAIAAVRRVRARQRASRGKPRQAPVWEPDHLDGRHPLARKAHAMCEARAHTMRRRLGKVACGECWETVIREDERLVTRTLRAVPDVAAAAGAR